MFEFFSKGGGSAVHPPTYDVNLINERIAELLADSGIEPDSKTFNALHKMLSDDVAWYFENTGHAIE